MRNEINEVFADLFREACRKCFGAEPRQGLSETESKHFGNIIFESTGLVIGPKSLKNYSFYVFNPKQTKPENPSVATLDTLARYVLNAPYSSETERKSKGNSYPYWYQYKNRLVATEKEQVRKGPVSKTRLPVILFILLCLAAGLLAWYSIMRKEKPGFSENFQQLSGDSMEKHGWILHAADTEYWQQRDIYPGCLTLFTLTGDNWADSLHPPFIKNLLLKQIPGDCFSAEVRLDDFVPEHNWQQTGILLLEDSIVSAKGLRFSLAYNDYFGGYQKPGEIIVQAIASDGNDPSKPEEILHLPVCQWEAGQDSLIRVNLHRSVLKIEKRGRRYRFLFAASPVENFAYREVLNKELDIRPRYAGIFALQGFVKHEPAVPVHIRYFALNPIDCDR